MPIGFSFVLQSLVDATPIQAFAAGAALCATSLGTTFTVLGTTGLMNSRLGVALTSAAMIDDVIGLVMVQVISNLGRSEITATTALRPILVSLGFAVGAVLVCRFIAKPVTEALNARRRARPDGTANKVFSMTQTSFILETLLLMGLVAASSYAGSSNLFASYIAGATISWWDSELPHVTRTIKARAEGPDQPPPERNTSGVCKREGPLSALGEEAHNTPENVDSTGLHLFHLYYEEPLKRILQPLFFVRRPDLPLRRPFC